MPRRSVLAAVGQARSGEPMSGDQVTNIPYFTLSDGMSSILTLNNIAPSPTTAKVTIFNTHGKAQNLPPITLDPHSFKQIDLGNMVASEDFDSGNIQVVFSGAPMSGPLFSPDDLVVKTSKLYVDFSAKD